MPATRATRSARRPRRRRSCRHRSPLHHQVAASRGRVLALSGADPGTAREADVAHRSPVVRPSARFLEPEKVAVLDQAREANRLLRGPALVRVGGQDEVVARCVSGETGALRVLLRFEPADLELERGQTELLQLRDLRGEIGVLCVIPADDRRELRSVTAPKPPGGWPSALPTASQTAVSTHAHATSPRGRSRKMSYVAGRASSQQRSTGRASSPISGGAISSLMMRSISRRSASSSRVLRRPVPRRHGRE
jgi:hypothetical protein